jgi:RNA polymerase sigma factor (TIGR02999 family)
MGRSPRWIAESAAKGFIEERAGPVESVSGGEGDKLSRGALIVSETPLPGERDVTTLLLEWSSGRDEAFAALAERVFDQLRQLARRQLRIEPDGHTLQPTALVNEAFLRLVAQDRVVWQNRAHFFAIAAQAMRRILVDHARRRHAKRRPDPHLRVSFSRLDELAEAPTPDVLDVEAALERLAALDPRGARIVELRFFGGLTVEEIAVVVEVSTATVNRELRAARAWLRVALAEHGGGSGREVDDGP